MSERIRVVLVDDHALVRAGVKSELGDAVDVVGEADDVEGAVDVIAGTTPDVVLLDVHLPGGNGPGVIDGVRKAGIETTSSRSRCLTPPRTSSR